MTPCPSPSVADAVRLAAGERPVRWRPTTGGGYTPAERWLVELADGTSVFAKAGVTPATADWLRLERRAYKDVAGPFMPTVVGWTDGDAPVLVLEDLSRAHWPPPWTPEQIERVLASLDAVANTKCPEWARPAEEQEHIFTGWSRIAADRGPFLSLQMASEAWLDAALPVLLAAEADSPAEGDALLHFDVRSDNICFAGNRTLLVDWNWIGRGNPLLDVAAWLPSLQFEGGPAPEEICPEAGVFAAALAGYFAAQAGLPLIPDAPHVRRVQHDQLTTALPWAARVLGLAPPDFVRD